VSSSTEWNQPGTTTSSSSTWNQPTTTTGNSGTWSNGNSQGTWQTSPTAVPQSTYAPGFGGQNIYVQVGAYGEVANALRIKSELDRLGFNPVQVSQIARNGLVLHRVRIGPIMTNALAESELMRLTNRLAIGGRPHIVVE